MKLEDVALQFLEVPRRFHEEGNVSVVQLLEQLDYGHWREQLTPDVFEAAFRAHPDKMADWLIWSENQRGGPAWYVMEDADGVVVGFEGYLGAPTIHGEQWYADRAQGYADFVKKALDGIARHVE